MLIHALWLRNFRNCEECGIEFAPRINLIWGANAQGKTSLLEGLFLCMAGRSFRTSQVSELVRHSQSGFYVEVRFVKNEVDQRIRITYGANYRKIFYNNTLCQSATALLGVIPGIVMTSDDINLVRGSPQGRRHLLDLQIAQTDPLYLHYLTRYHRAMRQRNQLLRQQTDISIESWEEEMSAAAAYVTQVRRQTVDELAPLCQKRYSQLTQLSESFQICYRTTAPTESTLTQLKSHYLEQLQRHRRREMQLGMTLQGPHKDDLSLLINERETRLYASEGQQRSAMTSLKLAEYDRLKGCSALSPIAIVDDVAISLDEERRKRLFTLLQDLGQVFISSAHDLRPMLGYGDNRSFHVHSGTIQEKEI